MASLNTKRIAKNTTFLYFRLFILMGVSLYSSRILLRVLGIEDFGIYGIVGGVVALFSSLRGMFASAIQRFLNCEMGAGNPQGLLAIFNTSVIIHIIICIIFFILAEGIGLWLLKYKLVILPERLSAAYWVFQFSVFTSLVTIMTIPFDAVIIANERMNFYAYISILDGLLKLVIIFILSWFGYDKLKLYAVLLFLEALLVRSVNAVYCRYRFQECRYVWKWDKKLFKEIAGFAGWNFAGNLAFTLVNEGINILLNIFGGVVANAARAIAYQVKSAIMLLLTNAMTAIRPQATQLYVQGKRHEFFAVQFFVSKMLFCLYICIAFPLFFYTKSILGIWLGEIPDYSVIFIQVILLHLLIRSFHEPLDLIFKVAGRLKRYQLTELVLLVSPLLFSYIILKNHAPLYTVFLIMAIMEVINWVAILFVAQKETDFCIIKYSKLVLQPCIIFFTITGVLNYSLYTLLYAQDNIFSIAGKSFLMILICLVSIWFCVFTKKETYWIKQIIKTKLHHK